MTEKSNARSTFALLLDTVIRSKHEWAKIAEQYGLTAIQLHTLGLLEGPEPRPLGCLCVLLGCDASNVTGIVDRLESQGLIERKENPADRRAKLISLTKKGKDLRAKIIKQMETMELASFSPLTPAEHAEFRRLLLKITPPTPDALS